MGMFDIFKNPTVKKVAKKAGVLAGAIVIEGIKGVAIKSATNIITTSVDSGMQGVKKMTLEDYVGRGKKKDKTVKVNVTEVKSADAGNTAFEKDKTRTVIDADWTPVDEVNVDQEND